MTGTLIVFEGIDACGKETQAKLLLERLKNAGFKTAFFSFPRYKTKTGQKIKKRLKISSKTDFGELFTQNFLAAKPEIERYLEQRYFVVSDRYTPSNEAYQQVKTAGMPKADLIIFLDLKPELAEILKKSRKEKDAFEKNLPFLKKVYRRYKNLARGKNWIAIKCYQNSEILPLNAIAEKIWQEVKNKFKL